MDRLYGASRWNRNNCEAEVLEKTLNNSGISKEPTIGKCKPVGRLFHSCPIPFIKSVTEDQTAGRFK
jgi:hypothetical protein